MTNMRYNSLSWLKGLLIKGMDQAREIEKSKKKKNR
jgi:hypothetical protein